MSTESEAVGGNQRVTFRASREVLEMLENIPQGKRSDYVNKQLLATREAESASRAARLKIAKLEQQINKLSKGCGQCQNHGKFFAVVLGHTDQNEIVESKVTVYCKCHVGEEQKRQSLALFQKNLALNPRINTTYIKML